jgi:hypothetical protein
MGDPSLGKLIGRHSLEAWGLRLGFPKVGTDIEDWSEWTQEIQARCVNDILLNKRLWEFLQPDGQPPEALELEQHVAAVCREITAAGMPFNKAAGEQRSSTGRHGVRNWKRSYARSSPRSRVYGRENVEQNRDQRRLRG